mmetsp:Transcript_16155/g.56395  ORF Transcript_16155/g.56395 Transcript_16155/m.56395 type:complete len:205 (+) Transcript_16155:1507-2121(+)
MVCCSMASCRAARSSAAACENSSMQQTPPSASASAPASSAQPGPSRTHVHVNPDLVVPTPLVRTPRRLRLSAACSSCDLPVPASPINKRWGCDRPASSRRRFPPAAPAASDATGAAGSSSGAAPTKRIHRSSVRESSASDPSVAADTDHRAPPMRVRSKASFGTVIPCSAGAVAWTSKCRPRNSSARWQCQNAEASLAGCSARP